MAKNGVEVAKAYVTIVPSMQGSQSQIEKDLLNQTAPAAEKAGKSSGGSFGKGLANGVKKVAGIATAVTGVVAGSGAALFGAANSVASYGDNVDKMSQKMGMSAKSFQTWDFVMQHCGTSIESMKAPMKTLATAAVNGSDAFDKLGISQEQIASMSQEELFGAVISGLQNVDNETERTALAGKLLGKGATELGALLNMSASETEEMKQQAQDLGIVMSDDAVKSSAAFKDSLQNLTQSVGGAKNSLIGQLLPSITNVMDGITGLVTGQEGAQEQLSVGISQFVGNLVTLLPQAVTVIQSIFQGLLIAMPELLTGLLTGIVTVLPGVISTLLQILPSLIETIGSMMATIAERSADLISPIIDALPDLIISVVNTIIKNLPAMVNGLVKLVTMISQKLPQIITALIDALPNTIGLLVSALIKCTPQLISAGIQLTIGLVKALPQIISSLIKAIPQIISEIVSAFEPMINKVKNVAGDVIKGFWQGINDKVSWLTDKIKSFCNGVTDKLKKFFKIGSPSKVMADEVGQWLGAGVAIGFEDSMLHSADEMAESIPTSFDAQIGAATTSAKASSTLADGATGYSASPVTINVYGAPGQDINALANIIMEKIQTATTRKAAAYA